MLITLITIAIASLAATPLVAPAVRRFANRSSDPDAKTDHETKSSVIQESTSDDLNDSLINVEAESVPSLPRAAPVVPQFSLELVKPVPVPSLSTQQSTKKPLVEVVWKTSSSQRTQINSKQHQDLVEDFRETPSADRLFEDSSQEGKRFESANKADPPRLIIPKPIGGQPKAARQIKPIKFDESPADPALEPSSISTAHLDQNKSVKRYQVGAEKFKMNPVASSNSATKPKSSAIPMFISTTPNLVSSEQHFEVIKPQRNKRERSFSLFDQPEQYAMGERAWLGVQPLYIDFSPFFSLDSLMEISPQNRGAFARSSRSAQKNSRVRRSGSYRANQQVNEDSIIDSASNRFEHIELLRDLNSEMDHYLHANYDEDEDEYEEEYEWNEHQQENAYDELEEVPEWQSLLGLSNHFLFDMKLNQKRMAPHQELTDQKLEDAIVFKITSGASGPDIQNIPHKKE